MNFWNHLMKKKPVSRGLLDPMNVSREEIDAAIRLSDEMISLIPEEGWIINSDRMDTLIAAIDGALLKSPENPDLLLAKSAALTFTSDHENAREIINEVLAVDPDNFQAVQRRRHWDGWRHVLEYPGWSTACKSLHPVMASRLEKGRKVQIVRDGLRIGMAVVFYAKRDSFPMGLKSEMRTKWMPILAETPHGDVLAHYLLVEDNPKDPFIGEAFLPTFVSEPVIPETGYWLIQAMSRLDGCFLVISDGREVFFNVWYAFDAALKSELRVIADTIRQRSAAMDITAFKSAAKWHMLNYSLTNVCSL